MNLSTLFFVGAVFSLIAGVLVTLYFAPQRAAIERNGIPVDAEITNLYAGMMGYTYFAGKEQTRQAGNYPISRHAFSQLKVGDKIQIRYLPDRPEISRPAAIYLDPATERRNRMSCLSSGVVTAIILSAFGCFTLGTAPLAFVVSTPSTSTPDLGEVHQALDARIPGWQKSASAHMTRLSAADAGFSNISDMREVDYGLCKGNHFYLFAMSFIYTGKATDKTWLAKAVAYMPDAADCMPEGWSIIGDATAIEPHWYEVYLTYPAQVPLYKLTATAGGN